VSRNSISQQILVSLLLAVLGILGAGGAYELRVTYRQEHERFLSEHRAAVERIAHNLIYPVWNLNRAEVEKTIRYEAVDPGVRAILVYDEGGKPYAGLLRNDQGYLETFSGQDPRQEARLAASEPFSSSEILKNGQRIGGVELYVSESHLQALLRSRWLGLLLRLLALIAALSGVLYYALRKVVIQPLTLLKQWAAVIGPGQPLVQPPAMRPSEEIGALAESFVKMAERLTQDEEWYRVLFEHSQYALMTLSPPAWRFDSGNPAAIALFGARDEADFKSKEPWQLSPPLQPDGRKSAEKSLEMIRTAMREGTHFFEWVHKRASGEEFPATVLLTRMEINGKTLLQATVRDETEKKKLQTSLAQQDRLASMGLLAAGVAHEINNPLAYGLINIENLAEQLKGQGLQEAAESAERALDGLSRIREITRGLGSFSRTESGERVPVDLRRSIEGAVGIARNEIKFRAQYQSNFEPLPLVLASEGKLAQVFLNLLINACHSIEEDAPQKNLISVKAWATDDDAFVEVRDTGKGIAPENLERIWEPFFTTKQPGKGTGLGLSICKSIIEDFDGHITVESTPGHGTCFTVHLPVLHVPEDLNPRVRPAAAAPAPATPEKRGRILVVDDEEDLRDILKKVLGAKHEVLTAGSGKAGQDLLKKDRRFDLILCDLMMPELSGMDLHEWLASVDLGLAEKIVFISGGAFTPRAAAYLAGLKNLRLEKPFNLSVLQALVAERMRQRGPQTLE
jgi:PAS domain S-box-containing protein